MQSSFIGSLMELSAEHEEIVYLTADSGEGGLDLMYQRNFPSRCYNFGIAEENMVAAAAGMALCGKVPFVYTAAPFLVYRAFEFIRDDLCLQNVPVKLVGSGSGISLSSLGPTHHTTEDIAVLRSLPNLTILCPATPKQAYECVRYAYKTSGPVYVRLGMNKEHEYFDDDYMLPKEGIDFLREGDDAAILTMGLLLNEVMDAAELLSEEGIEVAVASVVSIKPFDSWMFLEFANKTPHIFVIEEHNIIGGLGSIVSDELIAAGKSMMMTKLGLKDTFTKGYGTLDNVRQENGLDTESIVNCIREELS